MFGASSPYGMNMRNDIMAAQTILKDCGFYRHIITGVYDDYTKSAVQQYYLCKMPEKSPGRCYVPFKISCENKDEDTFALLYLLKVHKPNADAKSSSPPRITKAILDGYLGRSFDQSKATPSKPVICSIEPREPLGN